MLLLEIAERTRALRESLPGYPGAPLGQGLRSQQFVVAQDPGPPGSSPGRGGESDKLKVFPHHQVLYEEASRVASWLNQTFIKHEQRGQSEAERSRASLEDTEAKAGEILSGHGDLPPFFHPFYTRRSREDARRDPYSAEDGRTTSAITG